VAVEERFVDCFRHNPDFDSVIPVRDKLGAARTLLGRRFDVIVNLHGGPTSFVFSCLAWGRRVGAEHYQYAWLYHGSFPSPDPKVHTAESTLNIFKWMGLSSETPPRLRYEVQPHEREQMRQKFGDRPYVVLHPAALMATKRWPSDRFAQIAERLR